MNGGGKLRRAPIPRVALVLNVCESTMEIVLLRALTVRMVLVRKLYAKAVGLMPTLMLCVCQLSGLNAVMTLP